MFVLVESVNFKATDGSGNGIMDKNEIHTFFLRTLHILH
jgi:hypothetical protein